MTEAPGDDPELPSVEQTSEILRRLRAKHRDSSRYSLSGEVARGGMGVILKVRDEELRRDLAMKVVLSRGKKAEASVADSLEPKTLARFLEEAQITGQLDHPGIVPVHELGVDREGRVFFTMRLVKGRDLKEIFDLVFDGEEGWSQTRALGVMLRVCEAMAYAHSKNVIHRDLKPANVMVGRYGEVYVMDWGLARVLGQEDLHDIRIDTDPSALSMVETAPRAEALGTEHSDALLTMDGDVVGTPAYMAPEQAMGKVDGLDARADVYSVGAMLYHLLAGQEPYVPRGARVSQHMVLNWLLSGPPTPLQEVDRETPAELVAICEKAMARAPDDRYPHMQALGDDLRAFLEGRVVRAYETGAVAELRKWIRRNKGLAVAVLTAVWLAIGGLGAVGYVQARGRAAADEQRRIAEENEKRAKASEAIALENAERARRERANVMRLSALQQLEELQAEAGELWPAVPEMVPRYEQWLAAAAPLVAGLATDPADGVRGHYEQLAALRARATAGGDGQEWVFADDEDRWWHAQLEKLVAEIEAFSNPETGLIAGVSARWGQGIERRLEVASGVEERTVTGQAARAAWKRAADSIGDPGQCPRYEGLEVGPQLGLLPLGRDADSGLWEFVHVQTGEAPERGPDGRLVADEWSGLVFVLVPGGAFSMGSQNVDRSATNFDPLSTFDEGPVHEVVLEPFFLSKHEMTQAQWERFTGRNPSRYDAGGSGDITPVHPVEQISWEECTAVLGKLGLVLPTEAQWERACRAGTTTPWCTGLARETLVGAVNLADRAAVEAGADWSTLEDWPELDDGYAVHAPVGSFEPNRFGLYDVHGNVREWCREGRADYPFGARAGDGLRENSNPRNRVFRGGGFASSATLARSAYRGISTPQVRHNDLGVRPARALER